MKSLLLDLDGVICEYQFDKIVRDFFGVKLTSPIFAYDLADVLGVTHEQINKMFQEQVYGKPHFVDGSLEILKEWDKKDYLLMIFTNRVKYMGAEGLFKWLIENGIPFNGIDDDNGLEYDFHLDDSPAKLATTNSKVKLLYSQPWNRQCIDIFKQFRRVEGWHEIKEIVS